MISPCKDCTKRCAGCHSKCEEYKAFTLDVVNRKSWVKEKNKRVTGFSDEYIARKCKNDKRLAISGRI